MQAQRMLSNRCMGCLASDVDKKTEKKIDPIEVQVVRELLEVFPEELLDLPLSREISFEIGLLLGIGPISKAPYRMALAELKELQTQLQELIVKSFIHPSHSP